MMTSTKMDLCSNKALTFAFILAVICGILSCGCSNPGLGIPNVTDAGTAPDQARVASPVADMATTTVMADLASANDLAKAVDLTAPPDLTPLPDLTTPPDLGAAPDLMVLPDLTVVPDLTPVADMASAPFEVSVDRNTPVSNNYLMGSLDQFVASFVYANNTDETIEIRHLPMTFLLGGIDAIVTVRNIRLIDVATAQQIGATLSALSPLANQTDYAQTDFYNLNIQIPPHTSKSIGYVVDFTTYQDGGFTTTGQVLVPVILNGSGIDAVGLTSGQTFTATVKDTNIPQMGMRGAYAHTMTIYRTKLIASWAYDTPLGAASPNAQQVIAKIVVTNLANSGNYEATVQAENLQIISTIPAGTVSHNLSIYKDSLAGLPIATYTYPAGQTFNGTTSIAPADFNSGNGVVISSGQSRTFYVTLDTTGAQFTNTLSVRVDTGGIVWSDGVSLGLTAMDDDLPLQFKTFDY